MKKKILTSVSKWFLVIVITSFTQTIYSMTTDSLAVKNYIIKTYISILNRKPTKNEISLLANKHKLYTLFEKNKVLLVRDILESEDFSKSLFDLFRYEYLEGIDKEDIKNQINDYNLLLTIKTQADFADIFSYELERFNYLNNSQSMFAKGQISYQDFHKSFFNNKFYDDINMGDNNFVNSLYNYLFLRYPTKYELAQGKEMYNNQYANTFGLSGTSRNDLLNILFSSQHYTEGQINFWYNKILNRDPSPEELISEIKQNKKLNIRKLIERILLTSKP